jgi:endonuclease YncB( thermonuclease family)
MAPVSIFWDPRGVELDSLGQKRFGRITDGDTPYVTTSIRMLSIDTPEVHYPGNSDPARQDGNLAQLAQWIAQGQAPVQKDLAAHLQPRLATGQAGTLQKRQGDQATAHFAALLDQKLTRPGKKTKRSVFIRVADEHFDQYGRLLAYMAPSYTAAERAAMGRKDRATFNLLMIESGWAAPFPIYPSLPQHVDLVMLQEAGQDAFENSRGAWADPHTLTGYEFRMCVKLYGITKKLVAGHKPSSTEAYDWIDRFCVDMTTREIFYPQDYCKVKPYNRIFIWPKDVPEAVGRMNLVPGPAS